MGNPTSISTTGASSISTSGTSPLDMEQDPWRASMTTTSAPAAFHGTGSGPSSSSLSGRHFLDHHENDVWSKESTTKSNINIDWHLELDRASVTFSAERGSFFSKHVVYEVQSRHHRVKVMRRYSDFLWLHDVLVRKYPFRMLPRLPPKKFGAGGSEFLEQRRKALKRFLDIIVAHPVLKGSPVVISFLTLNEVGFKVIVRDSFFGINAYISSTQDVQHSCSKIPLDEEYVNATTAVAESEDNPNTAIDSELDQLRSKLPAFIQQHALVLAILERQCQRLAESALDYRKIAQTMSGSEDMGLSLFSLDRTGDCVHGKVGCTACRQLDIGMREIGTLVATAGGIYEDQVADMREPDWSFMPV